MTNEVCDAYDGGDTEGYAEDYSCGKIGSVAEEVVGSVLSDDIGPLGEVLGIHCMAILQKRLQNNLKAISLPAS